MTFVVVDVETANANLASICQVGVVGFADGREVFAESVLVDPNDDFDAINVSIHGITREHVVGAPGFAAIHGWLHDHFGGQIVVCHSPFDRTALRQACAKHGLAPPTCRWLDTASVARRAWPAYAQRGYGLANLAAVFSIDFRHHDAVEDARTAGLILLRAMADTDLDIDAWLDRVQAPLSGLNRSVKRHGDGDGPLVGEVVVITGALSAPRQAVADLIHQAGGAVDPGVTPRTTVLVVGDQDLSRLAGKTKSAKHLKAEQLIARGQALRIVGESDLAAMMA